MERRNNQKRYGGPGQGGGYRGGQQAGGGYNQMGGGNRRPQTAHGGNGGQGNFNSFGQNQHRFNQDNGSEYKPYSKNYDNNRDQNRDRPYRKQGTDGFRGGDRGGRGDRDGQNRFGNKPERSLVALGCTAKEAQLQQVEVHTNQYMMRIGKNAPQIYQYPIRIDEESKESDQEGFHKYTMFEVAKVVESETKRIEMMIGKFLYSEGFNIWTTQQLTETYYLNAKLMGRDVKLVIDHTGEYIVNTSDIDKPQRADCQAMSQILNVILKEAMKQTGLMQIGNRPKFFNTSAPTELPDMNMQIWSGFKACAYKYASGCALVIDNCSRFMTLETILDQINKIYDEVQE